MSKDEKDTIKLEVLQPVDPVAADAAVPQEGTAADAPSAASAADEPADAPKPKTRKKTEGQTVADEAPADAAPQEAEPTLSDVIREQAQEEDAPPTTSVTMSKILGADFFDSAIIRRQLWLFVLITVFVVIYISNRYNCQKSYIQIDRLNKELQDAKYKALSTNSRLTEQTRESRVLQSLAGNKDSVLHIPTQPPYIITVPEDHSNE